MKIDFLVTKDLFGGGGIETYTREVGRRLVARGHSVTVYSTARNCDRPATCGGMKVVWLPRAYPACAEKIVASFEAALHERFTQMPDVIHLHSVAAGAMAALVRRKGVPCVVQLHGIEWQRTRWPWYGRLLLRELEQLSFKFGQVHTAVSKTQCAYYSSRFGVKVQYIPTAATVPQLRQPDAMKKYPFAPNKYILSSCRIVREKGLHHLVRAFKEVTTDWHLVIAGDYSVRDRYYRELCELADGDKRIHFLGFVQGKLLEELYSNAGIYVQASELEGLAISLLEAMSYGIPCLVSDIPENCEAIGGAGITFANKDVKDLERKLSQSLRCVSELRELGARARARIQSQFTWDVVTESLEHLYISSRESLGHSL